MPDVSISVIVPSWKDEVAVRKLLPVLQDCNSVTEVIVANAPGPTPEFEGEPKVRVVKAKTLGRGHQLNCGARAASGSVLFFCHADSELEPDHLANMETTMRDGSCIGGTFYRKHDDRHNWPKWFERVERPFLRRWGVAWGDQGVFIRRDHFEKLGGFAEIKLMEDVEFSKRFRKSGIIAILDPPMGSSSRRFKQSKHPFLLTCQNWAIMLLYKLGVSPDTLHQWYYNKHSKSGPAGNSK